MELIRPTNHPGLICRIFHAFWEFLIARLETQLVDAFLHGNAQAAAGCRNSKPALSSSRLVASLLGGEGQDDFRAEVYDEGVPPDAHEHVAVE